jgi:signal transduction histidine kinase
LAIIGVCLAFIAVSLAFGWMNLRRLDGALRRLAASRGETMAEDVAADAAARFGRITASESGFGDGSGRSDSGGAYGFRSGLLAELSETAGRMAAGTLSPEEAVGWSVSGAALLNAAGAATEIAGTVPPEIIAEAATVARGEAGIAIRLFDRLLNRNQPGFLAQGLGDGGGAALVVVSPERFFARAREFALATAVENAGETGAAWLLAAGVDGAILAEIGPLAEAAAKVASPDLPASRRLRVADTAVLEISLPVSLGGAAAGRIRLGLPAGEGARLVADTRRQLWISAGFLAGLAVLAVAFLIGNQRRHDARIRRMERRVQGAERLSALGRLAGGVAHEIRNPLNAISIAVQRLARKYPDPMMGMIREEIRRLNEILEEFLTVARRRELNLRPGDLRAVAAEVAALMAEAAAGAEVSIDAEGLDAPCPAVLDADRMKQAILNLVKNALEATPAGGTIRLACWDGGRDGVRDGGQEFGRSARRNAGREPGFQTARKTGRDRVALAVADTGPGIDPETADRVFDLDFTTKERGVGLGLPLAHEIVRGHGGELRLAETSPAGTVFEIMLPRAAEGGEANAHSHRG